MAETSTTPAPGLTWKDAFMGLLPSLNATLQALATALIAISTTLATQHFTAPKAPMHIPAADSIPAPVLDLDPVVKAIEGIRDDLALERSQRHLKSGRPLK
jgi:hypothetical protein